MKITIAMIFTEWKKTNWVYLLFFIGILVLSCNQEKTGIENDINIYLSDNYEVKPSNNENVLYLFIPLDHCEAFLNETKKILLNQPSNKNLHLVLVAKSKRDIENYSLGLEEKYTVLKDDKGAIFSHPILVQTIPLVMNKQQDKIDILPFNITENFKLMQEKVKAFNP